MSVILLDRKLAEEIAGSLPGSDFRVENIEQKPFKQSPPAPFITSTLNKECARLFGWSIKETAKAAQGLYEQGAVSYIRTDSPALSEEATQAARDAVAAALGEQFLPESARVYASKDASAQEAHEAIRPASKEGRFVTPQEMQASGMSGDALKLYELVYNRTLASQMPDLKGERTILTIIARVDGHEAEFRAVGKVINEPGFSALYQETQSGDKEDDRELPPIKSGESLNVKSARVTDSSTKPPGRFDQTALQDELIKSGIGRPSTYASIISVIQDRGYVEADSGGKNPKLVPTWTGHAVTSLLEDKLPGYVDLKFTARMEEELDQIAAGKLGQYSYLDRFYNGNNGLHQSAQQLSGQGVRAHNPTVRLPQLGDRDLKVRFGASGPYIEHGDRRALGDSTIKPHDITLDIARKLLEAGKEVPDADRASGYRRQHKVLGTDPDGNEVTVREGRFGPYIQIGEGDNARRGSVPKDMDISKLSVEDAMLYADLNRVIGKAPDGDELRTGLGKYGPYLKKGDRFRGITLEEARKLNVEQAIELWNSPRPQSTFDNKKPPTRKPGLRGRTPGGR